MVLLAPQVSNLGTLRADGAQVGLIAADSVLVDVEGDGLMVFRVEEGALAPRVEQLGRIEADGGHVNLQARARGTFADTVLNMEGVVQARSIAGHGGQIILDGGPQGITRISGSVDVGSVDSTGGRIAVTGEKVLLDTGARLDATGADGGTILIGGGAHGADTSISNARQLHMNSGATAVADGNSSGKGGSIILWSDMNTFVAGSLSTQGGIGGFIETSAAGSLSLMSTPNAGLAGTWLIDPYNISIISGNTSSNVTGSTPFSPTDTGATLGVQQIETALLAGATVTVQTTAGSGSDPGNITLSTDLSYNKTGTSSLVLNAVGSIFLNGRILKSGLADGLNLTLQAGAGNEIVFNSTDINLGTGSLTALTPARLTENVALTANGGATFHTVEGPKNLTISSTGAISLTESIGATTPIGNLTITGSSVSAFHSVRSGGAVALTATTISTVGIDAASGVTLIGASTLKGDYATNNAAFSVSGTTTLSDTTTISTGTGAISFSNTVNGGAALTTTNTGTTSFSGAVGNSAALSALTASSGTFSAASTIKTTGA
ncbi:hypothetical protein OPU71_10870, partial [Niveibacterium sp. 24ML]|nr:hypothetical protein [Niveibacterium sp. 24ML]